MCLAKRLWVPVGVLVGSLVLGVGISEVCYRMLRRFACVGLPNAPLYQPDDRYGWGHAPNKEGWWWQCVGRSYEWRTYTKINAQGLRDRERTYENPAGTRRVLVLGDSMTEGFQVPLERTFAALVEGDLRARSMSVEVINAGVAGFGTDNELSFFRAEGVRYSPDIVVLVFNVANDVVESSPTLHARVYSGNRAGLHPKTYFALDGDGQLTPIPPAPRPQVAAATSWWKWIEDRLYLARALTRLGASPVPAAQSPAFLTVYGIAKKTPDPEWSASWAVTEALVREMRREVEHTGARFAVVVVPMREAVAPLGWRALEQAVPALATTPHDPACPTERLVAFLDREGIPTLNLLPPLRVAAERTGTTGFYAFDAHLDATGHARVAESLTPFIADLVRAVPAVLRPARRGAR